MRIPTWSILEIRVYLGLSLRSRGAGPTSSMQPLESALRIIPGRVSCSGRLTESNRTEHGIWTAVESVYAKLANDAAIDP